MRSASSTWHSSSATCRKAGQRIEPSNPSPGRLGSLVPVALSSVDRSSQRGGSGPPLSPALCWLRTPRGILVPGMRRSDQPAGAPRLFPVWHPLVQRGTLPTLRSRSFASGRRALLLHLFRPDPAGTASAKISWTVSSRPGPGRVDDGGLGPLRNGSRFAGPCSSLQRTPAPTGI